MTGTQSHFGTVLVDITIEYGEGNPVDYYKEAPQIWSGIEYDGRGCRKNRAFMGTWDLRIEERTMEQEQINNWGYYAGNPCGKSVEKGYADNEIPFSDIACLVGGTEVPFDMKDYLDDISMMDESRTVLAYRDISSTRKGVGKTHYLCQKGDP